MYKLIADTVVLLHFSFIVFVIGGGLLVLRWPRTAWLHLPAAVWGALVELTGWICPLTPVENYFRLLSGESTYDRDFIAQYLLPLIYPENLTVATQHFLGGLVIVINLFFYALAIRKNYSAKQGK